jgi:hypothetical protein
MPAKVPNPVIEEILTASENSLMIVKNPNGLGNESFRVYSSGEEATLLESAEELKGFEKSLKMQKVTSRLAEVASDDWDICWAWSLQAKTETLEEFLKSADKLEMDISLTDVVVGELTDEDLPRPKKDKSLVSMGGSASSGVWSGTPAEFDKYMRENGMPSIFGTDSDDEDTSENSSSAAPIKKSADELIEDMLNGKFEGDPIEGLFELGKALAEEPDSEDEEVEAEGK